MVEIKDRLTTALADRYRIERELGQGGMATVYLAQDLKHDRKVAVKVLRPELAAVLGAARFLQEIKTTANLQHPHILPLFDSGQAVVPPLRETEKGTGGEIFLYYVMPFVEGETLRDKLKRETQLSVEEAVNITTDVADALGYAHRHNVIHRDIKPENILLHEGRALVADFGIAIAVKEAGGSRLTETGLSLGTPQYMSPEQATADRTPDARSDVYSLGSVLYEMLAGEPPVTGPTAQAIIAKLLTEKPVRLRVVRDAVPEVVEAAVARALTKTPADRFADAGQFAAALRQSPAPTAKPRTPMKLALLTAAIALPLAVGVLAMILGRSPETPPLVLGRSQQLTADDGLEIQPTLSPDGNLVAYAAGNSARMRIYIRPVVGGRTIALSDDTSAVEHQPRWSSDGASILFLSRGGVSVASALGGSSRSIVRPATPVIAAAAWSPDGSEIVFVRHDSLLVIPFAGGEERLLANEPFLHSCAWAPDGRWIACVQLNDESVRPGKTFGNLAPSAIMLFPRGGGSPVRVVDARAFNQSPVWSRDARWLYFLSNRDGPRDIYAIGVESSGKLRDVPLRVTTGLGATSLALNADGTRLSYTLYTARSNIWSLPIAAARRPREATRLTSGSQVIEALRVSSDGQWLLFDSDLSGNADAYRMPVGGGDVEQLTNDPADEFAPDLSPDGRWVAYHSWRIGTRDIEVKAIGAGTIEFVTATPAQESYPMWSPDGDAILFYDQTRPFSIQVTRRGSNGQWTAPEVIARPGITPQWSPDGREIAYVDAVTDELVGHVMIVPLAGRLPRRVMASPDSLLVDGVQWRPDGRALYLKRHDADGRAEFWTVDVAGGVPRLLVRLEIDQESARRDFAVDQTRLYFTIEDRQSDVYVVELLTR